MRYTQGVAKLMISSKLMHLDFILYISYFSLEDRINLTVKRFYINNYIMLVYIRVLIKFIIIQNCIYVFFLNLNQIYIRKKSQFFKYIYLLNKNLII